MLHILWMLLKFILIVLGIVLGLLLLALLLVLFCPVRYRASVSKNQPDWKLMDGEAGVSWLFGGISFKVYRRKEENGYSVRILGIPIDKLLKKKKGKPEEENMDEDLSEERKEPAALPELPEKTVDAEEVFKEVSFDTEEENEKEKTEKAGLFQMLSEKLKEIRSKIDNIRLTFHNIHDKIEWWKKFIHHPRTQEAIALVWKYAKSLIRHILPTKIEGNVVFGSENPANTGKVLALLGMSFPFHKNCIAVTPLFDGENVLEGNIRLKGRVYGIVLVWAAVTIYFNKNVKYVINRVKHRNHKEG